MMPPSGRIVVRTGPSVGDVDRTVRHGLYVVRSRDGRPDLDGDGLQAFRIGVAGPTGSTFAKRLKTHAAKPNDANWTNRRRPFVTIWTAEVHGSGPTGTPILMAEHVLYAAIAAAHRFDNASGFLAGASAEASIAALADGALEGIASVLGAQLDRPFRIDRLGRDT